MTETVPGTRIRVTYDAEYVETQANGAILVRVANGPDEHWYSAIPAHAVIEEEQQA
jgi:hypothetical protein